MSENTRQHYQLATGSGKQITEPAKTAKPGFKKGGHVFKKGAQNKAGSHGFSPVFAGKKGNC